MSQRVAYGFTSSHEATHDGATEKATATGNQNQDSFSCAQSASISRPILAL